MELLNNINKKYKCPIFNYELENKDKYNIYNFSLSSDIRSRIKSAFRNQHEQCYYNLDVTSNIYNKFNHLIF